MLVVSDDVLLLVFVGCSPWTAVPNPTPRTDRGYPQFSVRGDGETILLPAWTFCIANMCADGAPPDDPPSVGSPRAVTVGFSERGWTVSASFQTPDDRCARAYPMSLTEVGTGIWTLEPAGPAGTYDVTLSAQHDQGGDAVATFTWATPEPGALPLPKARLLTDYLEFHVNDLGITPERSELSVSVTSGDGKRVAATPEPQPDGEDCPTPGRLSFSFAESVRQQLAGLGPEPHTYDVRLRLEGTEYRATARTPRDAKHVDGHSSLDLTFDPPLPAL